MLIALLTATLVLPGAPAPRAGGGAAVKLRSTSGEVISQGAILLTRFPHPTVRVEVDRNGEAVFRGLGSSTCIIEVEPGSLPAGMLGPRPPKSVGCVIPRGYLPENVFVMGPDGDREIVLTCYRAARVHGRVLGPSGEPAAGVRVELRHRAGLRTATTDAAGAYEIVTHPDRCGVGVAARRGHPLALETRPRPVAFDLAEGEHRKVDLRFPAGPCSVRGRVVDQDERPVPGLGVSCAYEDLPDGFPTGPARSGVVTSATGEFVLDDLPAGSFRLDLGSGQSLGSSARFRMEPGACRGPLLTCPIEPIRLTLAAGEQVDVGTTRVALSGVYTVQIELDSETGQTSGVRAELASPSGRAVPVLRHGRPRPPLHVHCIADSLHEPVLLTLSRTVRRAADDPVRWDPEKWILHEQILHPRPGVVDRIRVRVP